MKIVSLHLGILFFIIFAGTCNSQSVNKGYILVGKFDGRTPCQELAMQLNQVTTPECIKIKWRLTLYKDSLNPDTGIFQLEGFVFRKENILKGDWNIVKGSGAEPQAIVYRLNPEGRQPLMLLKCDENVLYFLDSNKNLMVGNRDFSYTLNRISVN